MSHYHISNIKILEIFILLIMLLNQ